jgi:integrase/recombinase XerD
MRHENNLSLRGETYWLRVKIRGRLYRESLHTGDVKSARRLRDARIKEIEATRWQGESRRPWREVVTAYLAHESGQLSASTVKRYAVSFKQVEPHLSELDIAAIDGKAIAGLVQSRREAGVSPATVRRDLTAVSRVLEFAEAMDWREGNPTLSKRRILKERRDPIALPTKESFAKVIAAASTRFAALILAARLTGCRQNELVTLTWRQFDPVAKTADVIGKGNKRRTITLSGAAVAHLAAQPRQPKAKPGDPIFAREDGEAFSQAASDFTHVRREVEKADKEFRRFRYHDLRHLFAVESLRGGMGIYALSKHLGHTSVKTTEIYLAFLTPEEADRARAA